MYSFFDAITFSKLYPTRRRNGIPVTMLLFRSSKLRPSTRVGSIQMPITNKTATLPQLLEIRAINKYPLERAGAPAHAGSTKGLSYLFILERKFVVS